MQRILNCHLVAMCVVILFNTGCCKTSPWSLAKTPNWGPSDFRYVDQPATQLVKRGDLQETAANELPSQPTETVEQINDFEAAPTSSTEVASTVSELESPGILPEIEMIDPAELTQQIREQQKQSSSNGIQLASEWKAPKEPIKPVANESGFDNRQVSYQETVMEAQQNLARASKSLTPAPSGMLKPLAPAAEVVSHPLRPILYSEPNVEPEPVKDFDLELKNLPPIILAAPPEANESMPSDPSQSSPALELQVVQSTNTYDTLQWEPIPEVIPEFIPAYKNEAANDSVRQVAWYEDFDSEKSQGSTPPAGRKFVGALDRFAVEDDSDQVSWQDNDCGENCPSQHVHQIATQIIEDGNEIARVQFEEEYQVQEAEEEYQFKEITPQDTDANDSSFVHPPLRIPPTELTPIREPDFPLPGLSTLPSPPTELPIPPINVGSDDNSFRLPQAAKSTIDAIPASASIAGETNSDTVANIDFEIESEKPTEAIPEFELPKPLTWREQLGETANSLQNQIELSTDLTEKSRLEGKLELLRLLPVELDETQQQYMEALTDLLHTTGQQQPQDVYAAGQTLERLKNAVSYMEQIASLKIVNTTFCNKVIGFGQFTPIDTMTLEAGQQILVYCEIENHSAQPKIIDGQSLFSTRLSGSFIVYDSNQVAVQQDSFPVVEDLARQRRQDFYMHIPLTLDQLPPGQYTYQLMVDDVGGQKSASLPDPIQFTVK